jgi:hypothetical protein
MSRWRSSRQLFRLLPRYTPSFVQVCLVYICSLYSSQACFSDLDGAISVVRFTRLPGVCRLTAVWLLILGR